MAKQVASSVEFTGQAAARLGKYLWAAIPRDSRSMRKQIGRRWLTHKVVRNTPVEGPLEYEHIVPVLVFALRREIHRETFTTDDCFGCLVTRQEHQTLLKLRSNPTILIASLACERDELLDVCLRRYSAVGLRLVKLSERVVAPRSGPIVLPS